MEENLPQGFTVLEPFPKKLKAGRSVKVIGELAQVTKRLRAKRRAEAERELEYFKTYRNRWDYRAAIQRGRPLAMARLNRPIGNTNAVSSDAANSRANPEIKP